MLTNISKFTGVQTSENIQGSDTATLKMKRSPFAGLFAALMALVALVYPAAAAYTPAYTPVAFATPTANVPDLIAIVFDCIQGALNIAVTNWLTMLMIVVAIVLIAWGAVVGLFRRGKKRGR